MAAPVALAYSDLAYPTILAVRANGGTADIADIERYVAKALALDKETLSHRRVKARDSRSEFQYRLAWVRTYLKNDGALLNTAESQWSLTEYGDAMNEEEARDVFRRVRNKRKVERDSERALIHGDNVHLTPVGINVGGDIEPLQQRPATFRFDLKKGKLHAEPVPAALGSPDASTILGHLRRSAKELWSAAQGANSPITRLIAGRAGDLIGLLDQVDQQLSAGDLVALWSAFNSFGRLLSTPEGEQETSLIVRHLTVEVLQQLAILASLSGSVREILAYRNAVSLDLEAVARFDEIQRNIASIASAQAFESIVDSSAVDALSAHDARKRDILDAVAQTSDIDAAARANLDASDIRKLQALDAANFASSLVEGVSSAGALTETSKKGWQRFRNRFAERFPEEMADAVIETAAATIKATPGVAFVVLGSVMLPSFAVLAALMPSLFQGAAKQLKNILPSKD